ncbi:MAG: hypothetical protein GXO37_03875 [Chloroflexi bacterium]|nr:hypothetical protein [Chloroflexota bacterium]
MSDLPWLPFVWQDATLSGRHFPHAAMFVPGTLPAVDAQGWFQFDLGAPTSVLYARAFTPQEKEGLEALQDPDHPAMFNGQSVPRLRTALHLGDTAIEPLIWLPDFGDDDALPNGGRVLGTVGADWVRGRVLVIDYPGQRLARAEQVPPDLEAQAAWAPLQVGDYGHVLMQLTVDGEPRWAVFDTGSSIFPLLTDEEQWPALSTGEVTDTLDILAWGQTQRVQGGPLAVEMRLGGRPLPVRRVYVHVDAPNAPQWTAFLRRFNMVGLMGNAPFLDGQVILDFRGGRFGMIPGGPAQEA